MKLFLTLLFFSITLVSAQSILKGKVLDKNGKSIYLANVYIEGTYEGGTTDSLGNFAFETNELGAKIIKTSIVGRTPYSKLIQLPQKGLVIIQLQDNENRLQEITIQAGVLQANSSGKNTVMSPLDIVTTAGSMGNIISALATLPGAQVAGESGRLMVHGGDASETQTYINGISVAQPYTATPNEVPVRGRFSPMLFKGVNFSTGGYSAEFGNALSSILALNTENKIEQPKTELSLSSVGLGLGHTLQWGKNSLTFNSSYTNLKPYSKIITPDIKWTKPYENASGEMIYRHQFKEGFLNIYGAYNFEDMGLYQADINYQQPVPLKKKSNNSYANITYSQHLRNRWTFNSGIGLGYLTDKLHYDDIFLPNEEKSLHIKGVLSKIWNNKIKSIGGIEYFDNNYQEEYQRQNLDYNYGYHSKMTALFTETSVGILPNLIGKIGLRGTSSNLQKRNTLEPRASLGYALNKYTQLSMAYGTFHQQAATPILKYAPQLDWLEANHYIANYFYERAGHLLRLEAYHKEYNNLIKYNSMTPRYDSQYDNTGNGKVKGFDLFYKNTSSIKNLQYWISYSYTNSKRNEANYPATFTPPYVYKHSIYLVGKCWFASLRSQLSLTNSFVSGRNYNDPNQTVFMNGRTKGYNNLSMSWSFLYSQQKIIHFSVSNVLGAAPIYGYQYADRPNSQGIYDRRPIVPTAKRFVFLGYFWTISKNEKENQLDNL
ncbi:carboxypeptidase-like regulatory domain-containing protein [Sphingobacterium sp.]|uniref:TonB-dependent receptor n=1 Tax=Sphingobacterium sp. TaxID=341027 RepID=UPI00289CBFFE|nr:carboxypeptidase-like regulatory domain-containing protein [Sphingobacterium sp.]